MSAMMSSPAAKDPWLISDPWSSCGRRRPGSHWDTRRGSAKSLAEPTPHDGAGARQPELAALVEAAARGAAAGGGSRQVVAAAVAAVIRTSISASSMRAEHCNMEASPAVDREVQARLAVIEKPIRAQVAASAAAVPHCHLSHEDVVRSNVAKHAFNLSIPFDQADLSTLRAAQRGQRRPAQETTSDIRSSIEELRLRVDLILQRLESMLKQEPGCCPPVSRLGTDFAAFDLNYDMTDAGTQADDFLPPSEHVMLQEEPLVSPCQAQPNLQQGDPSPQQSAAMPCPTADWRSLPSQAWDAIYQHFPNNRIAKDVGQAQTSRMVTFHNGAVTNLCVMDLLRSLDSVSAVSERGMKVQIVTTARGSAINDIVDQLRALAPPGSRHQIHTCDNSHFR